MAPKSEAIQLFAKRFPECSKRSYYLAIVRLIQKRLLEAGGTFDRGTVWCNMKFDSQGRRIMGQTELGYVVQYTTDGNPDTQSMGSEASLKAVCVPELK